MDSIQNHLRSARGAQGLPGRCVTAEEEYQAESDRIFSNHWLCIAREEELDPSSRCLPVQLENQGLILTRDDDGIIRAFRNFCRHRGSQLVNQQNCASIGKRIQCPYHAWTYDRRGNLVSAPNMNGVEGFQPQDHGLIPVPCEVQAGFVWVNFRPGQSLAQWLEPIADRLADWSVTELRIAHEIRYEVNANWKLIFQNYSECYHCPTVHPALNRLTPYRGSSNDLTEGPILGGPMSLADDVQTMSSDGKRVAVILPNLADEQTRSVQYFTLFPTAFLSLHPDFVLVHRIQRREISKTSVVCQFLFHPASTNQPGFDAGRAIEFWDLTNLQDWQVCELAQAGMSDAGYVPGPYSNLESVVAAFDRHYFDCLSQNPESHHVSRDA